MSSIDRQNLELAIQKSWCKETSANSGWSEENPSLGQCAVTACVVQDYLGGDILNSVVTLPDGKTDSHYFNTIDGQIEDLTRQQFPAGSQFTEGQPKTKGLATTRDYCLSYEETRKRYEVLKEKVSDYLAQAS
ncbi:MAG TPA: hypothetical protein VK983_01545 [Candidatus Limnocylindrales bacterium]|nr:hypothetical protein [Candidatus Limnocylindrales bacterium]